VLGISNVSFGLPPAGREVLNAVFMYRCVQAGLDMAIVNSEKLHRFADIPEEEVQLADNLLFNRGDDPVSAFADHFRHRETLSSSSGMEGMTLEERLQQYIISGLKDGLVEDLEEARGVYDAPLDIINGPLMDGMAEVGRLFNDNKLIVAEVLQSAEAMKTAVAHLEQYMEKAEDENKGVVLLATVKGDVHDIGKNLVDIIFTNNGYKVVNLGIKIPPQQLIEACKEHNPDMIGLSGLLVKSAQQMVIAAEELRNAGTNLPMMVGGAALSKSFTTQRIAPAYGNLVTYAQDAMSGLDLANRIMDPEGRKALENELAAAAEKKAAAPKKEKPAAVKPQGRSSRVNLDVQVPPAPDFERHVMENVSLDEVWRYVNPQMLYGKHLGLRGNAQRLLDKRDPKAMALKETIDRVKAECRKGWMHINAMWQFFPVVSEGERIDVYDPDGKQVLESFTFPRQNKPDGLALSDFVLPPDNGRMDNLCMLVTSAGGGIRERAEELKNQGEYVMSHALQALALETAEGAAEWLHAKVRTMWGFPDPADITLQELNRAKYRGKRYSFGYPACPNLDDQAQLFRLLQPEQIGVQLTDEFMMEPEASVSALVFHHPDAFYFNVGQDVAEAGE